MDGLDIASTNDCHRLATFARRTYAKAYAEDLGEARLKAHLENNMSDAKFRQMMESDVFYLAHENGELLGFAQVGVVNPSYQEHIDRFDAKASELRRLYVLSTYQGRGIGSALIGRALQDPRVLQTSTIYLTTWESNYDAQALYQRNGFYKVGAMPEYLSDGTLDGYELIMARSI